MILDFTKSDLSPKFDVVFIDEAQDLSLMQWDMARSIWKKTEDAFIAGDDDQAIFRWAGADVDSFITLKGTVSTHLHSLIEYRLKFMDLAMDIINKIKKRIDKTWKPKTNQGNFTKTF